MPSWQHIQAQSPEFAGKVRARFEVGINKTIATLRKDGSPRISATELQFDDGENTPAPASSASTSAKPPSLTSAHPPTTWSSSPGTPNTAGDVEPTDDRVPIREG